jgi:hypothetical protein
MSVNNYQHTPHKIPEECMPSTYSYCPFQQCPHQIWDSGLATEYVNWCSGNQWLSQGRLQAWSTICQTIWFLLLHSSCIWRNADNTHNMTDGAVLIRNNCEPILKATCDLCRANEEVIFPYYEVNITPSWCQAPTPRTAKTYVIYSLLTMTYLWTSYFSLQPT